MKGAISINVYAGEINLGTVPREAKGQSPVVVSKP